MLTGAVQVTEDMMGTEKMMRTSNSEQQIKLGLNSKKYFKLSFVS
jgi:hypothetical protein